MINTNELKAWLKRNAMTQSDLAERMGIDLSTLNRKINSQEGQNVTVKEAEIMSDILNIPQEQRGHIFFNQKLA